MCRVIITGTVIVVIVVIIVVVVAVPVVVVQLLYFSAAPDAYEGFLRALAVVMSTPMPRIPLKKKPSSPIPE